MTRKPKVVAEKKRVYTVELRVAGASYRQNETMDFSRRVNLGQSTKALTLRREPENEHDAHAIAVDDDTGICLGYLPARDCGTNVLAAALLDAGAAVEAEAIRVNVQGAHPWVLAKLTVTLS